MNRKQTLLLVLLFAAIVAAYANSFGNSFHFDDYHTVVDNPAIRSLKNVPRFFTDTTTFSVLPANRTYRPIVSTMLALDYALGHGYSLFWFHLSTFLWFCLLVLLLVRLYTWVFAKAGATGETAGWLGLFAAAWFGLHPAMAETVNYIIQRGDLYCTLGCVAALYVFARYPARRMSGLYLLPFSAAMLSKPPAAVFPLLLLLYVYFFENEGAPAIVRLRRAGIASLPSIAVTAGLLWLQSAMTPKSYLPGIISAADYRLTQPYVWLRYCLALFLPVHLNVDTDLGAFSGPNPAAIGGIIFVLLMLAAVWLTMRERRLYPIAYGLLWFIVTQLPTSLYALSEVENDHRMFFSFIGLILAVVWTGRLLWESSLSPLVPANVHPAMAGVAIAVLAAYGVGVHERNRVWLNEESLWWDDVQKSPQNGRGLMNYALTQMAVGRYVVANDYFLRALEYTPNYPTLEINLGIVNGAMADQGDPARAAEAERHFQRAIELAPNDDGPHTYYGQWLEAHGRYADAIQQLTRAVALNPSRPMQHEVLIQADLAAGDTAAAQQAARDTLAIEPDDTVALNALRNPGQQSAAGLINLSMLQYRQGAYQQSIDSARKALALTPNSAEAYNNIAAAYGAMQQWDEAIENVKQALEIDPTLQIAKNNLAWYTQQRANPTAAAQPTSGAKTPEDLLNESLALYRAGRYQESATAAQDAVKLRPDFAEAWNNVAAAEASMHHWDRAIAAAQKAIALKPGFQLAKNNLAWAQSEKAKAR